MDNQKSILYLIFFVVFLIFLFSVWPKEKKTAIAEISGKKINVEIADTLWRQYRGLSGRKNLCENCGMFFVFNSEKERFFVMRDMKFALDIIWINNGKIVKIDKNLPPEGFITSKIYSSGESVDNVLEVNAGFADNNNIKVGDVIIIK